MVAIADQCRRGGRPWFPRQPVCQRATAVHHHRAERRAVQRQAGPRAIRDVQALPGQLQDAGVPDPSRRHRAGRGVCLDQEKRHHHQPGVRRQRPGKLRNRRPVPDSQERRRGYLEPHHPLSRRQRDPPGYPGHPANQRFLQPGVLPRPVRVPRQDEGLRSEKPRQRAVLLQAASDCASAPGRWCTAGARNPGPGQRAAFGLGLQRRAAPCASGAASVL